MTEPAIIDMVFKIILAIMTLLLGGIAYFLKQLAADFRELKKDHEAAKLDLANTKSLAQTAQDGVKRLDEHTDRRFDDVARTQERFADSMQRVQSDTAGMLSALQGISTSMTRVEGFMNDIPQRVARLEGERKT